MKFRDFLLKHLLADTDYLVGYDNKGDYIRIGKDDLAASVASNVTVPTLQVQYSSNGSSWHDSYSSGDIYLRIKVGNGEWSSAIRISVSAYDLWRAQGNSGDEEDFLKSLKGEPGEVDISGLSISDINGYTDLLDNVNTLLQNARNAIIQDVVNIAVEAVKKQYAEMQLEDIKEVKNIADDDFITIVTEDGLRKVRISAFSDNIALRTVSAENITNAVSSQLVMLEVSGEQNGENVRFKVDRAYIYGTSHLFLNGQRLVSGSDYIEDKVGFAMLTHAPEQSDSLVFIAATK
ncbi:MAG: hypothetical protein IKO62_04690 [Bacteroidales bacterium]|nr:hypothetical protein [Bacteroidales bacterium]